jgi:hypothetical protein
MQPIQLRHYNGYYKYTYMPVMESPDDSNIPEIECYS